MKYTIFGGRISPPIDLSIEGKLPVSDQDVKRNVEHSKALGLKTYREFKASKPRLAVVGGGPSISEHLITLKSFDGDIWAINGAYGWCVEHGIEATFFAVDPHPIVAQWAQGAKRAILETRIDPSVFELLKDADVLTFDIGEAKGQIASGGSAVTAIPHLACRMGYVEVTLFGCESSYLPAATHAYQKEDRSEEIIIDVNGEHFLTAPDFYMQAMELSRYIREVPEYLKEESGGLLRALLDHQEFRVVWVSDELAASLQPIRREVSGAMAMADNIEAFGLTEKDVAA